MSTFIHEPSALFSACYLIYERASLGGVLLAVSIAATVGLMRLVGRNRLS